MSSTPRRPSSTTERPSGAAKKRPMESNGKRPSEARPRRPVDADGRRQGEARPRRPVDADGRRQGEARPRRPVDADGRRQGEARPRRPVDADGRRQGEARPRRPVDADGRRQGDARSRRPVDADRKRKNNASLQHLQDTENRRSNRPKHSTTAKKSAKKQKVDPKTKKIQKWVGFALFPAILFYYEFVFKISTVKHFWSAGTWFTLIFCLVYGCVLYFVSTLSKKKKINRRITLALLLLIPVMFLVEYFVYREFKIFYDLKTVSGGASDAFDDFIDEIRSLIFSFNGLSKIFLMFLPAGLYAKFGKKRLPAYQATKFKQVLALAGLVLLMPLNILTLKASPIGVKYSKEYTFQDAVANFGLVTGVRLDLGKNLFHSKNASYSYTQIEQPVTETQPIETVDDLAEVEETTEEPTTEAGYNEMEIDFEVLAENASDRLASIDRYVASLPASQKNQYTGLFEGKNLIMISAEAFSAELIDPKLTPTLYRLANKGIQFTDYYQPASAGTTGGEFQNLLGFLPSDGGRSFKNCVGHNLYFSMGNQLNRLGYYGQAFHNNTYTYYDRNQTHVWLGYSEGFMGMGNGMEQYVEQSWPESDLEMIKGTLPTFIDKQPFNIYYMTVSGHSTYTQASNDMTKKNWSEVQDMKCSDLLKGYYAANLELEKALAYLVRNLEEYGIADDTVICIAADHFPYGLDNDASLGDMKYLSELYGYEVLDNIKRDHNRLIIWSKCLEDMEPIIVSSPTFGLDIVPTLSNLFGTEFDSRLLPGRDALSDAEALVFNTGYDWKTDLGTYISATSTFTPAPGVTDIPDGYIDRIKNIVSNKINYCQDVLDTDYFGHIFGYCE